MNDLEETNIIETSDNESLEIAIKDYESINNPQNFITSETRDKDCKEIDGDLLRIRELQESNYKLEVLLEAQKAGIPEEYIRYLTVDIEESGSIVKGIEVFKSSKMFKVLTQSDASFGMNVKKGEGTDKRKSKFSLWEETKKAMSIR